MASNFAPGGSGVYRCQSNPAAWSARLYRVLLIPCIAFSGVTLQQSAVQAQSFMERRIQQRMEQRLAERRREEANLTDSQKQQLLKLAASWLSIPMTSVFRFLSQVKAVSQVPRHTQLVKLVENNSKRLSVASSKRVVKS